MTGETFGSEYWLEYEAGSRVYDTIIVSHMDRWEWFTDLDLPDPANVCCTVIASYLTPHDVPIMDRSV